MQLWAKDMVLSMVPQRTLFFKLKTISYNFFNLFIKSFWSIVTLHKYVVHKCTFYNLETSPISIHKGQATCSPTRYCKLKWMHNYCLKSWPNKSISTSTSMVVVRILCDCMIGYHMMGKCRSNYLQASR
jgi:hypothetical protein